MGWQSVSAATSAEAAAAAQPNVTNGHLAHLLLRPFPPRLFAKKRWFLFKVILFFMHLKNPSVTNGLLGLCQHRCCRAVGCTCCTMVSQIITTCLTNDRKCVYSPSSSQRRSGNPNSTHPYIQKGRLFKKAFFRIAHFVVFLNISFTLQLFNGNTWNNIHTESRCI